MEYYPYLPIEDEGRLNDYWIRRDFLTKMSTFGINRLGWLMAMT
jgi:hypothetical protein